ncbi:hypothetical protein BDZ97DRAFT_1923543 [Flammula alnicola]|nr:hypothetical protein BDZ97DRAFT_1923543 [Flammula alnicola]
MQDKLPVPQATQQAAAPPGRRQVPAAAVADDPFLTDNGVMGMREDAINPNFSSIRAPHPSELVQPAAPTNSFYSVTMGQPVGVLTDPSLIDLNHQTRFAMAQFDDWYQSVGWYTVHYHAGRVRLVPGQDQPRQQPPPAQQPRPQALQPTPAQMGVSGNAIYVPSTFPTPVSGSTVNPIRLDSPYFGPAPATTSATAVADTTPTPTSRILRMLDAGEKAKAADPVPSTQAMLLAAAAKIDRRSNRKQTIPAKRSAAATNPPLSPPPRRVVVVGSNSEMEDISLQSYPKVRKLAQPLPSAVEPMVEKGKAAGPVLSAQDKLLAALAKIPRRSKRTIPAKRSAAATNPPLSPPPQRVVVVSDSEMEDVPLQSYPEARNPAQPLPSATAPTPRRIVVVVSDSEMEDVPSQSYPEARNPAQPLCSAAASDTPVEPVVSAPALCLPSAVAQPSGNSAAAQPSDNSAAFPTLVSSAVYPTTQLSLLQSNISSDPQPTQTNISATVPPSLCQSPIPQLTISAAIPPPFPHATATGEIAPTAPSTPAPNKKHFIALFPDLDDSDEEVNWARLIGSASRTRIKLTPAGRELA